PDWDQAHRQLGYIYARLGLWLLSTDEYRKAVKLKPRLAADVAPQASVSAYNAALYYQAQGKPKAAIGMLTTALQYRPTWTEARHYLAYVSASTQRGSEAARGLLQLPAPAGSLGADDLQRVRAREPLQPPPPTKD